MMSAGPSRANGFGSCGVELMDTPMGTVARSPAGSAAPGLPSTSCSLICVAMPLRTHD